MTAASLRPKSFFTLRSLLRRPSVSRAEIEAFQCSRLRRLVSHAYEKVPFYRRLLDRHGLKPQDIRSLADLAAIPVTSRKDLQSLPAAEVCAAGLEPARLVVRPTSGSTGEPVRLRRTWFEERLLSVYRQRAFRDFGLRATDLRVRIADIRPRDPGIHNPALRLLAAFGLCERVDISDLLPVEEILRELRRRRPEAVTGFAGAVARVAARMTGDDRRLVRPRFVAVGGEVLTRAMREQIRRGFEAPVWECYGCEEFNLIAWECRATGFYHTCDDAMIVEVHKDGRAAQPGERGELVGTALRSFAMPLIRYRLGDVVTRGPSPCPCGEPFATLAAIEGRLVDYFPLPGGGLLNAYSLVDILVAEAPWIRHYQLTQERKDRIALRVVPLAQPPPDELARVRRLLAAAAGPAVELNIEFVADIPAGPDGKFRLARSLAAPGT